MSIVKVLTPLVASTALVTATTERVLAKQYPI